MARAARAFGVGRAGGDEHLPHVDAPAAREELAVGGVEGGELRGSGLAGRRRGDGGGADSRGQLAAHARIDPGEPELETALHQQLLVDQPIEDVTPQRTVDRLATSLRDIVQRAPVVVEADGHAVDAGHGVAGRLGARGRPDRGGPGRRSSARAPHRAQEDRAAVGAPRGAHRRTKIGDDQARSSVGARQSSS